MQELYRHHAKSESVKIDLQDVLRYMGCGTKAPPAEVMQLVTQAEADVRRVLDFRACYRFYDIDTKDGVLNLGFMKTDSASLHASLKGCCKIVLFGATIGVGTDRLIQRYTHVSPGRALAVQAVGAAAIEAYCDLLMGVLEQHCGGYLRQRFSPGYGDFALDSQREVCAALDCARQVGITLTDRLLMVPSKSVTALAGIQDHPLSCLRVGCEACDKTNCAYRSMK